MSERCVDRPWLSFLLTYASRFRGFYLSKGGSTFTSAIEIYYFDTHNSDTTSGSNRRGSDVLRRLKATENVTFQDSHGNLWFGSEYDGVARFDGKNWQVLNYGDGLSGLEVKYMLETPDGDMWFGTENSITRISAAA
jgi:hypothetical protein